MMKIILSLYLQSLLITSGLVIVLSLVWFVSRAMKGKDKTVQERRQVLIDLLMINAMTIPILSFGVVGILIMLKG